MTTKIQQTVMRRIRIIRAIETVTAPTVLGPVLMLGFLWGVGKEVWVARVIQNISTVHTPEGAIAFALSAFLNTRVVVQVLSVLVLGTGAWFAYGITKLLEERSQTAFR